MQDLEKFSQGKQCPEVMNQVTYLNLIMQLLYENLGEKEESTITRCAGKLGS
jgi:23S rRNA A1618 N6-methylase RlmF